MRGVRPLKKVEVEKMYRWMVRRDYGNRDKAMFLMMVYTGFRIREVIQLKVGDVIGPASQYSVVSKYVKVERRNMKGKVTSRVMPLHGEVKKAIRAWLAELFGNRKRQLDMYLFKSRQGKNKPISEARAYQVINQAAWSCGIDGPVGNHSCRKTFAMNMLRCFMGNLVDVKKALGHSNINSTMSYLESCGEEEFEKAVLKPW